MRPVRKPEFKRAEVPGWLLRKDFWPQRTGTERKLLRLHDLMMGAFQIGGRALFRNPLKRSVELKMLTQVEGTGASGPFRLGEKSKAIGKTAKTAAEKKCGKICEEESSKSL